jgi:glutathione S-transferase
MPELTLYGESTWMSPWVFHVLVALEEKQLTYTLDVVPMPMADRQRKVLQQMALLGKLPILQHGDVWISESLAISEYLAEQFPTPAQPRLFPADLAERARARQIMSMLRTSMAALRDDRPTSSIFGRPAHKPLSEAATRDAAELLRIAGRLVQPGQSSMFANWCIADADLSLALMRMVAHGDPMPQHLADYANQQWERKSVRKYLSHIPTLT